MIIFTTIAAAIAMGTGAYWYSYFCYVAKTTAMNTIQLLIFY